LTIDLAPRALWGRPVVVGGGVAGGVAALTLAPRPVVLLDPAPIGQEAASRWAQGGIAAAVGPDDSPRQHALDTVAAGAGLSDPEVAARITAAGPAIVAALERFGARFDRDDSGALACGLEAAHARRRILHVRDATGSAVLEALGRTILSTPSIERIAGIALDIVVEEGAVAGIVLRRGGENWLLPTRAVVLATGGVGGLWSSTTNPGGARGSGLVLAGRAGAALADLEFMQFHPTALAVGADPMPLISEAVRGEGAFLIDAAGGRFMTDIPGGDLAPRDVVARAVFHQWSEGGRASLDVRHWPQGKFAGRFPNIRRVLASFGLDPAMDPIPVRPAAHYHMGGVKVDPVGRTGIAGLWACGEVACTGLHGANRLASNSLLEAAVCGRWVAEDVLGTVAAEARAPQVFDAELPQAGGDAGIAAMRDLMDRDVGVVRDAAGLERAVEGLARLGRNAAGTLAADAVSAALLITLAALRRTESRGAHWRSDAGAPIEPPLHSVSAWSELAAFES
jgi:L-aspartate oxidase